MKIRYGLVSNSSSSSFIVQIRRSMMDSFLHKDRPSLSSEEIEKLKKIGFVNVGTDNPFHLEMVGESSIPNLPEEDKDCFMGLSITCNQDIIMQYLIKNNIPFKAAVHYGHEFCHYQKDSEFLISIPNAGLEAEMYESHLQNRKFIRTEIRDIPVSEYMQDYDEKDIEMFYRREDENE